MKDQNFFIMFVKFYFYHVKLLSFYANCTCCLKAESIFILVHQFTSVVLLQIWKINEISGRVIYWGKSAVSISPASGDTCLSGFTLQCELNQIEKKLELDTGMSKLLKGTENHFVILVGDRGLGGAIFEKSCCTSKKKYTTNYL